MSDAVDIEIVVNPDHIKDDNNDNSYEIMNNDSIIGIVLDDIYGKDSSKGVSAAGEFSYDEDGDDM